MAQYQVCDIKPTIISALGAIPKPDSTELRIIQDFSRPYGNSVNSYADPGTYNFTSVDNAAKLIRPGSFMCKIDIRRAYRHAGLHPSQYKFTGMQWHFEGDSKPTYMYDTRLPFGASESVGCFHRITQSIVRMMQRRVDCDILCYIDDFLIISNTFDQCLRSKNILITLLTDLGFDINWDKCVGPSQQMTFLGIILDSADMSMSIPPSKLREIRQSALMWCDKQKATKRQIQSIAGKIQWTAKCVKAVRPVLRSLIDLQKGLRHPSHRIRLPAQVKSDIRYFCQWCVHFNGVVIIPADCKPQPDTTVFTDASLDAGAAYCKGDFVFSNWAADAPSIAPQSIYIKELCAILLAYRRWCHVWSDRTVHIYTDNIGALWAIRKGLTQNNIANNILREILWISAYCNISFEVHYIRSKDNYVADSISRMNNRQYLLYAAELLSTCGIYILHPSYNILRHMSPNSYMSFLSVRRSPSSTGTSVGPRGEALQTAGILRQHQEGISMSARGLHKVLPLLRIPSGPCHSDRGVPIRSTSGSETPTTQCIHLPQRSAYPASGEGFSQPFSRKLVPYNGDTWYPQGQGSSAEADVGDHTGHPSGHVW